MDNFLIGGGFGEKLQNRELEELIPIRVVAEKLAHPLVVAVERIHIVPPTAQKTVLPISGTHILFPVLRIGTLFTVNGKNRHDDTSDDCVMREDSITGGIKR